MSALLRHWFISDLHLGHKNILKYDSRPFSDIQEHDQYLTHTCAEAGRRNRTLWLLGDIATRRSQLEAFMEVVKPKWEKVILIRGNHDDRVAWKDRRMFDEAHESRYVRIDTDVKVYLSHYAHRVWRNSHHGAYHLYGHSHGALPPVGRSMDVGAPCISYKPLSMETVVELLKFEDHTEHY